MFTNNLKIAIRYLLNNKRYSLLNIIGLAVGMAVCIIILTWVNNEISYDKFNENSDNIFIVTSKEVFGEKTESGLGTPPAVGPALKADYTEILNSSRFNNSHSEYLLTLNEQPFKERVKFADPTIFDIFSFPFIRGNHEIAKNDPHIIMISEEISEKFANGQDLVGQTIRFDNKHNFTIGGIFENIPENSSIQFDIVIPLEFLNELWRENSTKTWYNSSYITYVQLQENASSKLMKDKIYNRIKQSRPESNITLSLYPFTDLHLHIFGFLRLVIVFSFIAIFILVIACFNFINMSTARAARRAREVGLRKVVGGSRRQLIMQFFGESLLISLLSLLVAIILAEIFMPIFNNMLGKNLELDMTNHMVLFGIPIITIITGIISGIYPALLLSSYKPINVLKSSGFYGGSKSKLRKNLVVFQFVITIVLITSTIVIFKQTEFMTNKQLGFNKDHLVYIPLEGELKKNYQTLKNDLVKNNNIINATVSSRLPKGIYTNGSGWKWDGKDENLNPLVTYLNVDCDYLKTMDMELAEGEFFSNKYLINSPFILINEKYAEITNLDNPVGTKIYKDNGESYTVIGVVKDFHFKPVSRNIGPLFMFYSTEWPQYSYITMRITNQNIEETLEYLETTVRKHNPSYPFEFHFLENDYDVMFRSQKRLTNLLAGFAILAIIISCLGLFGLTAFMAEQRTKEIGIRKTMGATVPVIIGLLIKDISKSIMIANIVGWPVSFIIMTGFLQNFPYRISISLWIFILSGIITALIALIVVAYQTIKAATANPIDSLRYE